MPTNLAIDDKLLDEAVKLGGKKTKKATVNDALHEYVQRRKQLEVFDVFGQIEYDERHDYKGGRKKR